MSDEYEFRTATPGDYDEIIAVVDEWWGRPIAPSLPRLFLDHCFATSTVVESRGEMVAFLVALLSPSRADDAYIHFVGVHPDHRHAALARRLYEDFFAFAAGEGRRRVSAITSVVNAPSIAFHERMGFTVRGPIAGYNGPGSNLVVFERALDPSRSRTATRRGTPGPLAYAPFPELTDEQLRAIVDRHGITVGNDDLHRLDSMGNVHSIYALGAALVLRVPKLHPDALADAYTGSVAAPVAVSAGVSTPRLVVFDESLDIVPVPFSIFERVHAEPLSGRLGADPQKHRPVWYELGRQLARLHANVTAVADPNGYLDPHRRVQDPEPLLTELERNGHLGDEAALWARDALRRLRPAVPPPDTFRRFIHGDVTGTNVLVRGDTFHSLIDWDDAGWGDPAMDLVSLPLRVVDAALAGYRSVMPLDGDDTAEQRILWDKLIGALARLRLHPEPPASPAWPTPSGRLFDLLAAAADGEAPIVRHLHRRR